MTQERIDTAIAKKVDPQGLVVLTPVEQILKGALAMHRGSPVGLDRKELARRIGDDNSAVWDALASAYNNNIMSGERPMMVSHHEQDIARDFPGTVAFYSELRMDRVLAEAVSAGDIEQTSVDTLEGRLDETLGILRYIPRDEVGVPQTKKIEIVLRQMILDSINAVTTAGQFAFVVASHQVMGTLSDQLAEAGDPNVSLTERKRLNQVTQNLLRTHRAVTLDPEVLTREMEKRGLGEEDYQGRLRQLQTLSFIISVLDAEGLPRQKIMLDGLKKGMHDAVERLIINYPEKARNIARRFGVSGVKRESWAELPGSVGFTKNG